MGIEACARYSGLFDDVANLKVGVGLLFQAFGKPLIDLHDGFRGAFIHVPNGKTNFSLIVKKGFALAFFRSEKEDLAMKKSWIIALIVYPVLAASTFCLVFFLRGNFSIAGYVDPLFFSGIVVLGVGLLGLLGHFGAFDFLVYGFRSIFKHMNLNYSNAMDEYPDYYAYVEGMKKKRTGNFPFIWPWFVLSVLLLAASFILRGIVY